MSRLYDRLMRSRYETAELMETPGYADIAELLPFVTVVEATNIAAYCAEDSKPEERKRMLLQPPTVAPPLENFWVEWRSPRWWRTKDGYEAFQDYYAAGWHVVASDARKLDDLGPGDRGDYLTLYGPEGSWRWGVIAALFVEQPKGKIYGPVVCLSYSLDEAGRLLPAMKSRKAGDGEPSFDFWAPGEVDASRAAGFTLEAAPEIGFLQSTIAFTHCKNVTSEENIPPEKPSGKHRRAHGAPLTRYYTLEIEPMKTILRREGRSQEVGLERALHICRGHFATYSDEKPLFGKYSGTFWKPQHIKGNNKSGEIVKDYAVNAPGLGK